MVCAHGRAESRGVGLSVGNVTTSADITIAVSQ